MVDDLQLCELNNGKMEKLLIVELKGTRNIIE
jgi:hypothetical protein